MFYNKNIFEIEPKRHNRKIGKVFKGSAPSAQSDLPNHNGFRTVTTSEPRRPLGRTPKIMSDSYRRPKQRILD